MATERTSFVVFLCGLWLQAALSLAAGSEVAAAQAASEETENSTCLLLQSAAQANGLPFEFFARVIWQESHFDAQAVGPVTRNGSRAEGIAQFMPGTAKERQLLDPYDPIQALPKAAEYLRDLRNQFGNLGLAAAAYNAGPRRVREWLAGTGPMPAQTRAYVLAITGHTVEDWSKGKKEAASGPEPDCKSLMASLRQAPSIYLTALEQHVRLSAERPFGVELAAGFSRAKVLAAYAKAMQRFSKLLAGHDPVLSSMVLRSRGTRPFYQARAGTDTLPEANSLCSRLRAAGAACIVTRHQGKIASDGH